MTHGAYSKDPMPMHEAFGLMNKISKLLTRFGELEQGFPEVLAIAAEIVPMHCALVIESREGLATTTVWHAPGASQAGLTAAIDHGQAALMTLQMLSAEEARELEFKKILATLPFAASGPTHASHPTRLNCVVLPLVVDHHPIFGVLQIEGVTLLTETSLAFVNALANQLAIALERNYARKIHQELVLKEHAAQDLLKKERVLTEGAAQFRSLANLLPQLCWMTNPDGWVFWYNQRWFDYTGTTLADMQGWGWRAVHHPDHVDQVVKEFSQALATGQPYEGTFPVKGADGQWQWFLCRGLPIKDDEGNILWWFGTHTDITELRRAKDAAAYLAAIVTSSHDAVISKTLDNMITSWNHGAERMFGFAAAEVIGQPVTILIPPELQRQESAILATILGGEQIQHVETTRIRRDGSLITVSLSISPVKDETGQIVAIAEIARDITQQKLAESELQDAKQAADRANRTKSRFLAHMSHEIRNPLAAIMGFADLLGDPALIAADRQLFLDTIIQNGRMLGGLIDDILDLAKIEADKVEVERLPLLVSPLIAEVVTMFNPKLVEKGLRIRVVNADDAPKLIVSDKKRLQQILVNIIGNAVKFSNHGEILVSVSRQALPRLPEQLVIAVKDQGPGLTLEQQKQLFQPFVQADASINRQHGGSGLGLVISRRLACLLGGDVTIGPREENAGCTFIIKVATGVAVGQGLEVHAPKEPPLQRIKIFSSEKTALCGIKVLIADDSPDNRLLYHRSLVAEGATVEFAEDGQQAVDKALVINSGFDLVLMDIQMPQVDGLEATRRLRHRGYKGVIIAFDRPCHARRTRSVAGGGVRWAPDQTDQP